MSYLMADCKSAQAFRTDYKSLRTKEVLIKLKQVPSIAVSCIRYRFRLYIPILLFGVEAGALFWSCPGHVTMPCDLCLRE